ncbi:hypothetical protein CDO43_20920, partial [Pseudomonas aeruginosa]
RDDRPRESHASGGRGLRQRPPVGGAPRRRRRREDNTTRVGEGPPAQPRPPPAPRVTDTDFRISNYTKSAPEVGNAHLSAIRAALATEAPNA